MILDLHVHTVLSGDAKPTVEEYAERVVKMRERYNIDGFVVTEHRLWRAETNDLFAKLSEETGLVILQGIELETDFGHILIYGVNEDFAERIEMDKRVSGLDAVKVAYETGAFPVVAHPSRPMVGCGIALTALDGIKVIEHINGGSLTEENERTLQWMNEFGMAGTGGSDAHYIDEIAKCLTVFENPVNNDKDLVRELDKGDFHAVYIEETLK